MVFLTALCCLQRGETLAAALPPLPGRLDATFDQGMGANGVVMDLVVEGAGILIGGSFTEVDGIAHNGIARLNADGHVDANFGTLGLDAGVNGFVWAVAVQSDGRVLIGGQFSSVDGVPRPNLARLTSNGSLDPTFDPGLGPDNAVADIVLQADGKILIGGDFRMVNGSARSLVARLNPNGSVDATFDVTPSIFGYVRTLARQADGRSLIGGSFSFSGGVVSGLARLNTQGTLDTSFLPTNGPNATVETIIVQSNGRILLGGHFTSVAGVPRNRVARLLSNGSLDPSFDPGVGPNQGVTSLALQNDGRMVLGGGFTSVAGRLRHRVARLHSDGRLDDIFVPTPGANDWVEAVALDSDGRIVLGGAFTNVNGLPYGRVARLMGVDPPPFPPLIIAAPASQTVNEGVTVTWQVDVLALPAPSYQWQFRGTNVPGATLDVLVLHNVRLTNAGDYRVEVTNSLGSTSAVAMLTVNPAPRNPGAPEIDFVADVTAPSSFPAAVVNAIAVQNDSNIVIGGFFDRVNGAIRDSIARLQPGGEVDAAFVPTLTHGSVVQALALPGDAKVLVSGSVGLIPKRLTSTGSLDETFIPPQVQSVGYALAVQADGRILMGAPLALFSVFPLVRYHTNGALDTNFLIRPGPNGAVRTVAVQSDGRILIGGEFTSVHGVLRNRIARLEANGAVDLSFDPGAGATGGTSFIDEYGDQTDRTAVFAIVVGADGRVLLGGDFSKIDGVPRRRIARLNSNGSLDGSFDPGPGPTDNVLALALQPDGKIIAGGSFKTIGGIARHHVARWQADGSLDLTFDPLEGPNATVRAVSVLNGGAILIGGEFTLVNGIPRPTIAKIIGGDPPPFAPVIEAGPTNVTVVAGEDVTLTVFASGVPPPTYQWQWNGVDIPGATGWRLTFRNVRTANAGVYRVLVSNPGGTAASMPFLLTVLPAPRQAGATDIDFYTGLGPNDRVNAIAVQPDRRIVIGGAFTDFDAVARGRIARLEHSGTLDLSFDPGLGADGPVYALALQPDGRVLLAGAFTTVDGQPRGRVARLNGDGSVDANFSTGLGVGGSVLSLALRPEGTVLIGGAFTVVQGILRPGLARLNTNGSLDATFVPALRPGSSVTDLAAQSDGSVLIAGWLVDTNNVLLHGVRRLTTNGALDATFPIVQDVPYSSLSLALQEDGGLLVGGGFNFLGGLPRNRIARLTGLGAVDLGFAPGTGASNVVRAIALQADGKSLIGGEFTGVDGRILRRIARLQTNGMVDVAFDPGQGVTEGSVVLDEYGEVIERTAVDAIAVEPDGRVLIGGDFTKVNGITRPYLARLYGREPSSRIEIRTLANPPGALELFWEIGVLQQAPDLGGPWNDVSGATSPQHVGSEGTQRFFRLRIN